MNKLFVNISEKEKKQYPIIIDNNLLENAVKYIRENSKANHFLVVTNDKIFNLYGNKLNIPNSEFLLLPDGEQYKNLENYKVIIDKAVDIKLERNDAIIALGGGVIGDIAGFAAATYQRGIDFIQIPTTLLAQTDSSIGGKVAVNHPLAKNFIGCFYQPKLVLSDILTLQTLDKRQFKTGLAEIIKYAFIEKTCNCSENFNLFEYLLDNKDNIYKLQKDVLEKIIYASCSLKSAVVNQDEKENGLRAILNYGHTYAHAIEKITDYKVYTHGEAVASGMFYALNLAYNINLIDKDYFEKSKDLLCLYDLCDNLPKNLSAKELCDAMIYDKKVINNKIRFVLPISYKEVKIFDNIPYSEVLKSFDF